MSRTHDVHDLTGVITRVPGGGILHAWGTIAPTDATPGYAPGCIFLDINAVTGAALLYINEGTLASCDFNGLTATIAELNQSADESTIIEVVTTTNVIAASESGKTFFLSLAGGFVSTLPAVAAGLHFNFIVKTAPTTAYTIVCPAAAALFIGGVYTVDVNSATDPDFGTTGEATITFVANKAVPGDRVEVFCDGTNWYATMFCSVFDAITIA